MYELIKSLGAHWLMPLPVSLSLVALGLLLAERRRRWGLDPVAVGDWMPSAKALRKSERAVYEALALLAVRWEQP